MGPLWGTSKTLECHVLLSDFSHTGFPADVVYMTGAVIWGAHIHSQPNIRCHFVVVEKHSFDSYVVSQDILISYSLSYFLLCLSAVTHEPPCDSERFLLAVC